MKASLTWFAWFHCLLLLALLLFHPCTSVPFFLDFLCYFFFFCNLNGHLFFSSTLWGLKKQQPHTPLVFGSAGSCITHLLLENCEGWDVDKWNIYVMPGHSSLDFFLFFFYFDFHFFWIFLSCRIRDGVKERWKRKRSAVKRRRWRGLTVDSS